jgi:hypothetical protein
VRREALGQLRAVIVTAPDRLREELRGLPVGRLLERCSRLRRSSSASADELATRLVLRSLARRIEAATREADELERELLGHVRALAAGLLDERAATQSGIDSAAAAIANSTARCTPSYCTDACTTLRRVSTSPNASPKAKANATPPDCSSATSPDISTGYCNKRSR